MNEKEKLFLEVLTIEVEALKVVMFDYLGVDQKELNKARAIARNKVRTAKELQRKEKQQNGAKV